MASFNALGERFGDGLEDMLRQKYLVEKKTMREIGNELGVDAAAIFYRLKKFGIPTRKKYDHPASEKVIENARRLGKSMKGSKKSDETRRKISDAKKGRLVKPSQYGGHSKKRRDGYIKVYVPTHPHCSKDGYVMEHRLVMESHLGRYLEDGEVVHHINRDRKDNRLENLLLMTFEGHAQFHMNERHQNRKEKIL